MVPPDMRAAADKARGMFAGEGALKAFDRAGLGDEYAVTRALCANIPHDAGRVGALAWLDRLAGAFTDLYPVPELDALALLQVPGPERNALEALTRVVREHLSAKAFGRALHAAVREALATARANKRGASTEHAASVQPTGAAWEVAR